MIIRFLIFSLLCALTAAAGETGDLRRAVEDLTGSYGPQYPRGAEFIARLNAIEQRLNAAPPAEQAAVKEDFSRLQREALLANPLLTRAPLLFVVRQQYRPDHHNTATFFPNARNEFNDGKYIPGGALKTLDLAHGNSVRTLLELPEGVIRDPEINFAGTKIVFSMRTNTQDSYHLYEIAVNGSGLRQLTFAADVDDLDPLYLADDDIAFSSTREPKYCMCNRHIMANLYRMGPSGENIHQIGKSTLFEGHGSLMPDGRILYDRWEYVDRNFGDGQSLWTVNPDGSNHAVYWGNNTASPGAVIDARIIAGTDKAICIFGSCHDRPWGALAIIDRNKGMDGAAPVVRTWPADATNLIQQTGWEIFDAFTRVKNKYEDPCPLSDKYFLCSRMTGQGEQMGIYLLDIFGNELLVHVEGAGCFDPMPIGPRPRPPVLPSRRSFEETDGVFYVHDVYRGTHLQGVQRGEVKFLRVVESPEKRTWTRSAWGGQGTESPAMNWHDFNNKRILGTVPVEPDGSVYLTLPSEKFVYFQLLDAKGMMIQSMRSGTMVQPGESTSCVGCHEDRLSAPTMAAAMQPRAAYRPPTPMTGWHGPARLFNYLAEVQPVFDRHCVRCHDFGKEGSKAVVLAGDRDLAFNASYTELWRKKLIHTVGAGPSENLAAKSWGSHASKLVQTLLKGHHDVKLSDEEFDRIVTWIDLNAPYYPSYASAYPDNLAGRSPLDHGQLARLEKLTGIPFEGLASHGGNRGPQISFDRPEASPCLAKFTDKSDPQYAEALALIRLGKEQLDRKPEADMAAFQACAVDQWREEKYQARRAVELRNRDAIRKGEKVFDKP